MTNDRKSGQRISAMIRAIIRMGMVAPIWVIGSVVALRLPIFADPLAINHKPVRYVVVTALLTWAVPMLGELLLAMTQGAQYTPTAPVSFPGYRRLRSRIGAIPAYARNGLFYLLLLASLPVLLILTTTTIIAFAWMLFLSIIAMAHAVKAVLRYLKWKEQNRAAT